MCHGVTHITREGHQLLVGLWVFAAELPIPTTPAQWRPPQRGCSRKHKALRAWNLTGSGFSACLSSLLCDGSTSSSPLAQHREFHISGSFPGHIFACHSQELRPEQFHGTRWCPCRAGPPWDQLCSLAALECSKEEKPCGWVRKVSDYWQSILIYINNSAILNTLCIVLIFDILSIMCQYLGFHCDFNT